MNSRPITKTPWHKSVAICLAVASPVLMGIHNGEQVTSDNQRDWSESVAFLYGCTGLLIAPHVVLTARHCGSMAAATFFTYDNTGRASSDTIPIIDRHDFPDNADLSLRILDRAPMVRPYWNPVLVDTNSIAGETIELAGYGGNGFDLHQALDCALVSDAYANNGDPTDLRFTYDCTYPFDDTNGTGGDSGAPVFLETGELVGVHTNSPGELGLGQYLAYTESNGSMPYLEWIVSIIEQEDPDWAELYDAMELPLLSDHVDVLSRFAVFAEDRADFHDRGQIYPSSEENDLVWGERAMLGSDARSHTLITGRQGVTLRERARVEGDLVASGSISRQNGVVIEGATITPADIAMPSLGFATWEGGNSHSANVNVNAGKSKTLNTGHYYGDINLNSGAELVFPDCGQYFIDQLVVNSGAKLKVRGRECGITQINIKTVFIYRGQTEVSSGETLDGSYLLVGAWGTSDSTVVLQETFYGTIVAPYGRISLACNKNLVGAAFGEDVTIFQDARVIAREGGIERWIAGE